jgi:hypothetical protein
MPETESIGAVTPFDGRLVGIGNRGSDESGPTGGLTWSSADGITWERGNNRPFRRAQLASIAAGPKGIVVVGSDRDDLITKWSVSWAWYSPDGRSWTTARLPGPSDAGVMVYDVAWGPRGFVAVGNFSAGEGSGRAGPIGWSSIDGRRWTRARFAAGPAEAAAWSVASFADGYITTGSLHVWTSRDGRVWHRGVDNSKAQILRVTAGNGWLVGWTGFSADPRLWVSQDGKEWRQVELPGFDTVADVVPTPGGFVAIGSWDVLGSDQEIRETYQVIATARGDPTAWVQAPDQPEFHEGDIVGSLAILPGGNRVIATGGRVALFGVAP